MGNPIISYPDFTIDATLTGGSWSNLNNLKTRFLAEKARSTNVQTASTIINVDLGANLDIQVLGVIAHNISSAGTVRIRGYSDSGYTTMVSGADTGTVRLYPTFDASTDINSVVTRGDAMTALQMATGRLPVDLAYDFDGDGQLTVGDAIAALTYASNHPNGFNAWPANWFHCFTSKHRARYWKVEISDSSNLAGYIELGRLWIGPASFAPAVGISYGVELVHESKDIITESIGGVLWAEKRPTKRVATVQFNSLTTEEKRTALNMQRHLGLTGEMVWIMDSAAPPRDMIMEAFLCNIRQTSAIKYPYYNNHEMPLELVEIV